MRKLRQLNINSILFLDIETAPNWEHFKDAPENVQKEWIYKFKFRAEAPEPSDDIFDTSNYEAYFAKIWTKEAGLYPEFSRIICISFGFMNGDTFRLKSVSGENEKDLLIDFVKILDSFWAVNKGLMLCAHNGKNFDFPFITKRLLMYRLEIPLILDVYGLKPWEILGLLDTLEIWKMSSYSQGGGLPAIAMHFGIPTPKDDIDGSQVSKCFHAGEIDRIVIYCEKDVITLANVFKAMRCEEILRDGQIQKIM
jgi:uncharacterized protein YprB with RNaseH-like and TPR domain